MKWQLHPAKEGLAEHSAHWDALNRAEFEAHPLLETAFVGPLVCHFGSERTKLAVLDSEEHGFGGALLVSSRSPFVWSTFLPSQAQIAPAILPPARVDALSSLMRQLPSRCWLLEVLRQDREYSCFRDGFPAGVKQFFHTRTMRVDLSTDFATYWEERPKGLRKRLRRYWRAAHQERSVSLRLRESPFEVAEALKRYGDLEVKGWKGNAGTAVHAENAQGRFYADVLDNFARRGRGYVYELYVGNRLAASRLCIASEKMMVILKTTYDEALAGLAPGRLLLYLLLESEFRLRRHQVIEFYTNAKKETLAWGTDSREVTHVSLFLNRLIQQSTQFVGSSKRTLGDAQVALSRVFQGRQRIDLNAENDPIEALRVDSVTSYSGFAALRDDWDTICHQDGYRSLFLSHAWFDNFLSEVVDDDKIQIYVVRSNDSGSTEALFPMMRVDRTISTIPSRGLMFISNFYSPLAKPIYATRKRHARVTRARALIRHLIRHRRAWTAIDFNMIPRETQDFEVLQEALSDEGVRYTTYFCSANWIAPTSGTSSKNYAEQLPSIVKNTLRRRLRKAWRDGNLDLHVFTEADEIAERMNDYDTVYARSWKRPEPYRQFHRKLAARLAAEGKVALGLAYFNRRPVAAQLWLFHEGVASILKLCYDQEYRQYSFGTILTYHLMCYAIDERCVVRIDYLTGDESYKRDWMSVRRERWGVVAFNENHLQGRLAALTEVAVKPRLKRIAARYWGAEEEEHPE